MAFAGTVHDHFGDTSRRLLSLVLILTCASIGHGESSRFNGSIQLNFRTYAQETLTRQKQVVLRIREAADSDAIHCPALRTRSSSTPLTGLARERLQTEASVDTEDRNAKHAIPLVGDFDSETGALTATQTRCP